MFAEDEHRLVFLDESGINIDMTRRYGRSKGKTRVVDSTPLNTPTLTTILSSVRMDGRTTYTYYQGGTTGDKFVDYLRNNLIPDLNPDDIVIMDNLRSHKVKEVKEVFEEKGITFLYLPPYSPDLNPIEQMWSKIKAILRKIKPRTIDALLTAISTAFSQITESDCIGWFYNDGYC